jgi:hypothetical protein
MLRTYLAIIDRTTATSSSVSCSFVRAMIHSYTCFVGATGVAAAETLGS